MGQNLVPVFYFWFGNTTVAGVNSATIEHCRELSVLPAKIRVIMIIHLVPSYCFSGRMISNERKFSSVAGEESGGRGILLFNK